MLSFLSRADTTLELRHDTTTASQRRAAVHHMQSKMLQNDKTMSMHKVEEGRERTDRISKMMFE